MTLSPKPVSASTTVFSKSMLPSDANPWGNVHGGEIMRLIDECAGAAATRHARQRVVTARVDELSFVAPVYVGNLVTARASVNDVGTNSMEVGVRVDAEDMLTGKVVHVSTAYLVFVAIGEDGKTAPLPQLIAETAEEKSRMAAGKLRHQRRLQR
jgi:acyl-CoA hydrolase